MIKLSCLDAFCRLETPAEKTEFLKSLIIVCYIHDKDNLSLEKVWLVFKSKYLLLRVRCETFSADLLSECALKQIIKNQCKNHRNKIRS